MIGGTESEVNDLVEKNRATILVAERNSKSAIDAVALLQSKVDESFRRISKLEQQVIEQNGTISALRAHMASKIGTGSTS